MPKFLSTVPMRPRRRAAASTPPNDVSLFFLFAERVVLCLCVFDPSLLCGDLGRRLPWICAIGTIYFSRERFPLYHEPVYICATWRELLCLFLPRTPSRVSKISSWYECSCRTHKRSDSRVGLSLYLRMTVESDFLIFRRLAAKNRRFTQENSLEIQLSESCLGKTVTSYRIVLDTFG